MTRLYLFAEGQTEQTFADTVLKPHLAICRVYMHNPVLIAHARKKGKVHRGGGRNFEAMHNDILRFLKQESGSDVFFTTMIDLYGLPQLPDYKDAKTTVGPQAAQLIGLPTIRSRCPHFNDWLNRLECLASEKG